MPGNFVVKAAKHSHVGAASLEAELPQFEVGETQRRFVLKQLDGQTAMPNVPYTITMANGEVIEGVTDAEGATQLLQKDAMNIAKVDMKHTKSPASAVAGIAAAVGAAVAVGKLLSGPDAEAGRALSEGEISLAKDVFGDSIDYSTVRLRDEDYVPWQGKDYVMAPNGHIYFGEELRGVADWSLESLQRQGLFIHEMTHVWQHQHGVNVLLVGGLPASQAVSPRRPVRLPVGAGKDVEGLQHRTAGRHRSRLFPREERVRGSLCEQQVRWRTEKTSQRDTDQ